MAGSDLGNISSHKSVLVAAVAEIDPNRRRQAQQRFKTAKVYGDWREMLEKEGPNLDCVNASTPDHMHACMGMSAMQMGLHVYGQKPLTHDVAESRALTEFAKENKLMTQMGIQIHSSTQYRTAVQIVHDGVIGKVKEAHSFSNKRWGDANPNQTGRIPYPKGWIGMPGLDRLPTLTSSKAIITRANGASVSITEPAPSGTWVATFMTRLSKLWALPIPYPSVRRANHPTRTTGDSMPRFTMYSRKPSTPRVKNLPVTWYDGGQRPPAQVTSLLEGKNFPVKVR